MPDIQVDPNVTTIALPAYKGFVGYFSTDGSTDDPSVTEYENTFGASIVWAKIGTGEYTGTLAGAFPIGKTVCPPFGSQSTLIGMYNNLPFDCGYNVSRNNDNSVLINVFDTATGDNVDFKDVASGKKIYIEIRVYP
jgi:hypothetical protein